MTVRPGSPSKIEPLNLNMLEAGYESKLRGESLLPFKWLNVSWRMGWFEARKALKQDPSLAMPPRPKSGRKKKGTK